jgi:peptidoglycan/LPS O-acetylase OafA/YrhL
LRQQEITRIARLSEMSRVDFLDGLRGWGSLFVVLYHVFAEGFPLNAWSATSLGRWIPFNGPMAVFLFFVVSGFSLSVKYLATNDLRGWIQIAAGRYLRLAIPIIAICLIVHLALVNGLIVSPEQRLEKFRTMLQFEPTLRHLLIFSLFDVFFDYRFEDTYVGPLWTMSIELSGSAVVLCAIVVLRQSAVRPVLLCALAGLICGFSDKPVNAMLALFLIGAAIADIFNRGWFVRLQNMFGTALVALGWSIPLLFPNTVLMWGVVASSALTIGCILVGPIRNGLSGPLSAELGRISFPLYLVHGPVMWLIGEPLTRTMGSNLAERAAIDVAVVIVSIILAYIFIPINDASVKASRGFGRWIASAVCRIVCKKRSRGME